MGWGGASDGLNNALYSMWGWGFVAQSKLAVRRFGFILGGFACLSIQKINPDFHKIGESGFVACQRCNCESFE